MNNYMLTTWKTLKKWINSWICIRLNKKHTENLNTPLTSNKTEAVIQSSGPNVFAVQSHKTFKRN